MTTKIFKGIYTDLSNEDYHAEKKHLSSSNLKMLLKDPEKFYNEKVLGNRENKQVNAFDEGNYAHSLILEPEHIPEEYAFFPGFKKMGNAWKEFKLIHDGNKIMLSKPQKHRVESWVEAYKRREAAVDLIKGSKPEISLFAEFAGVPVKVRADAINIEKGYIADVKTTSYNPEIDSFKSVIDALSYDLSAALYTKVFEQHYGKPFDFYFIVLGKREVVCEVYKASKQTLQDGEMQVKEALLKYKKCIKTGDFTNNKKSVIVESGDYEIREI